MNKQTAILMVVATAAALATAAAHADHIDNHIWIETADGNFVIGTDTALHSILPGTIDDKTHECYGINNLNSREVVRLTEHILETDPEDFWSYINNHAMIQTTQFNCDTQRDTANRLDISYDYYHECVCGHMYANQIKDKYTYTVTDLPDQRELPIGYEQSVLDSIQAALDMWGDINDIEFTYTDSRLRADIVIQQDIPLPQRGDSYTLANGDAACLIDNRQCTIQLFTDLNLDGYQTLMEPDQITETISHELGHNFGLPHNIEHDNIMAPGIQDDEVRTYYEVHGLNVPSTGGQHTHETGTAADNTENRTIADILCDYTDDEALRQELKCDTMDDEIETTTNNTETWTAVGTNADNITQHEVTIDFINLARAVLIQIPVEDRFTTWTTISAKIFNEIFPEELKHDRLNKTEDGQGKSDIKHIPRDITWDDLARNTEHIGEIVAFEGTAWIIFFDNTMLIRNNDGEFGYNTEFGSSNEIYVTNGGFLSDGRKMLENDKVTIYGRVIDDSFHTPAVQAMFILLEGTYATDDEIREALGLTP